MNFLEYVAKDIRTKYGDNLSRIAVVFPNKRASLFLNDYLVKNGDGQRPIWSPAYTTISELFRNKSKLSVGDPIKLICELYKVYTSVTGTDEELDHFYSWGQLMISDFDDIDKNMANADLLFQNTADIHEFDSVSYLSEEQKDMLRRFFANFTGDDTELKKRFVTLWNNFDAIYHQYNESLTSQGIAYEGALYRRVAVDENVDFEYDTYIFVGFNLLQKVEQLLFTRLKKEGKAHFYWDFDKYYMRSNNEAGTYIRQYLADFPNEFDIDNDEKYNNFSNFSGKRITYVSAATENIQARYVSTWLQNEDISHDRNSAIVMCNETILPAILHAIPTDIDKVNITIGYPLQQTPVATLIAQLISLQTKGFTTSGSLRRQYMEGLLTHPYARYISTAFVKQLEVLRSSKRFIIGNDEIVDDKALQYLFHSLDYSSKTQVEAISAYIVKILRLIADNINQDNDDSTKTDSMLVESIYRAYTLATRLRMLVDAGDLNVNIVTYQRLISQIIATTTIPFHGEPAVGLQIMGVLETRNIDFNHVLLLSCNEGMMPKGVNDTSFIPYTLRRNYGLTTIDNKVSIYAYYFYRLLQRAKNITIAYNTSTDGMNSGEMSRFMLQMLVESGHSIIKRTLQAGQNNSSTMVEKIEKNEEVMQSLIRRFSGDALLTPSAINKYQRCPLVFFYNYVGGIREPEDEEYGEVDNRIFGNIFHRAAELLYRPFINHGGMITSAFLESILKNDLAIEKAVKTAFRDELFGMKDDSKRMPQLNGMQLINFKVITRYVKDLMRRDIKLTPFRLLGLETTVMMPLSISSAGFDIKLRIGGKIDRLDQIDNDGRIRVVDYKTGTSQPNVKQMTDIFQPFDTLKHSDYYLQTFLYSFIVRTSAEYNPKELPVAPALLYIQHAANDDYNPILTLGTEPVNDIAAEADEYISSLRLLIEEIFSPSLPFRACNNDNICKQCKYHILCGR